MTLPEGNVLFALVVLGAIVSLALTAMLTFGLLVRKVVMARIDAYCTRETRYLSPVLNGILLADTEGGHADALSAWRAASTHEITGIRTWLESGPPWRRRWHRRVAWGLIRQLTNDVSGETLGRVCALAHDLGFSALGFRLLSDRRWWKRVEGCRILAAIRLRKAMYPLVERLGDQHMDVRNAASQALISIVGATEALGPILQRTEELPGWLRIALSEAIREAGMEVVPQLLLGLESHSFPVRAFCLDMLGDVGDPRAVDPVYAMLEKMDTAERVIAIGALARIGDARSYDVICAASADQDERIRCAGIRGLGRFGSPEAIEPLCTLVRTGPTPERVVAAEALGALGFEGMEKLRVLGAEKDDTVRAIALHVLDTLADPVEMQTYEEGADSREFGPCHHSST